jgi:hypothetical protein
MFSHSSHAKRLSRLLQGAVVIVGVAFVLNKAVFHNAAYDYGAKFVATDPRVTAVTGQNRKTSLRLLRGFRFKESEQTGSARMTIRSTAAKGEFDVALWLDKREGRWELNQANVSPVGGAVIATVTR